ncbi:ATP-binding protein [Arcobacter porcinus]|uniref:Uncharacterized protein n=1 Tax=Arcobacter porcinus TaxID=1935204 RepID=A0A5C2HDK5_9BACT|nr:ATP-binding protein [Arcobacter porcinus]OCL85383.1 hypothetical protein AAX30_01883 [Arcobacter porcinus]OCL90733.1 hypothetical protein AAX27_01544 [Aliarcobacter thereius]QEP40887.1 hypothetical protein APORC_1293 [Arcobacter porcinus]
MEKEEIIIKIEESLDANNSFEVNNLLQKRAIEKIKKLVENRLIKTGDCSNRKHDTITVLGERGSGKTSLLLSLKTILKTYEDELIFLRIIDPTLFETKQNILVSIISLITDEVKDQATDEWRQTLVELGDGLKLLDGIGSDIIKSDLFDDGALILEKGLDHANSGLKLEENLNKFICQSLSLLSKEKKENKKMFILVFDDIDTNIDKGWMVLETIRKYLTSCKLQLFVSGDWELYSSLVRMKQWENFDRRILPENEWHDKVNLVNDLEEQYLIKVLKPEYRIYLENFYQLTKKTEEIFVKDSKNKTPIKLIYQYISKILFNFENKLQQEEVSNLIKQLPIRTNMKIFYAYSINKEDTEELINDISNVFITNTARFNFTHLDYEYLSTDIVIQEMAKKLYLLSDEQFSFEKLSQFPMNLSSKDINLLLMVINLHLSKTIDTRINTFFEWLTRFTYLNILGKDVKNQDDKKTLLSRLKYNTPITIQDQISLLADENNNQTNKKSLLLGFRATYAFTRYAKKQSFIGIDTFQRNAKLDEKFLLNILLSRSGKIAHSEQSNVSIINIFTFLHEFLQKDYEDAKTYLLSIFEEYYSFKGDDHLFRDDRDEIIKNSLYKSLLEWHKLKDYVEVFSIFQINRIWDSFLNYHESNLQNKKFIHLKDFITAQITLFFNLLVTELIYNKNDSNPYGSILSPTYLNKNLQKAFGNDYVKNFYDDYKELDFFRYMYLCPVLYCFLQDSKFVIPKEIYWIGQDNKNRIHTSFGTLGIINTENQKEDIVEDEENINNDSINASIIIEKNYLNTSDLNKIRKIEKPEDLNIIENAISEVQSGKIKSRNDFWNKIKKENTRITSEREEILDRFLENIQHSIEADDL